jgi:hypothetical protein
MVSFYVGFAAVIVPAIAIWLGGKIARKGFVAGLTPRELDDLNAQAMLGRSWREFRSELRLARARADEIDRLRKIADECRLALGDELVGHNKRSEA